MTKNDKRHFANFAKLTVRIGTTPETRTAASGQVWAKARVAVSMGKVADSHDYKPSLWLTAKAFSRDGDARLPEALAALEKGTLVTLSGRLAYDEYTTAAGEKRSDLSLLVYKIEPFESDTPAPAPAGGVDTAFDPPEEEAF